MKAPDAYRTITEVAEELALPAHVLRFWETKFPQITPLKRGGGRRYYRPEDIAVIRRIQDLLHRQRYTIQGVQQLFDQEGTAALPKEGLAAQHTAVPPMESLHAIRNELADMLHTLQKKSPL